MQKYIIYKKNYVKINTINMNTVTRFKVQKKKKLQIQKKVVNNIYTRAVLRLVRPLDGIVQN